ncbi:hypothetical protein [Nesterenkonia xinjiangensis]|uniref:ABC-type Fe3+ transport system permease subunit n=1 Tax=Nesterenkonia xinjiangensis TaxID=225327 RepID=A0A7Z0KAB3_9MICC|nr:hypothetical protein [Nesterenkonia xinjiangensis]NYJ79609.1 ABC-type Fe3+ transport system permease subunit [Nesterenkonia xinjiangensis]
MVIWFILVAVVFTVLTVVTFFLDGLLDSVLPDLGGDGLLSSTSLCAAVAGAGYGGWMGLGALELGTAGGLLLAGLAALVVLAVTGLALRAVRRAETPQARLEDTIGTLGKALTGAPAGSPFEFTVPHHGHPLKISAVAEHDVVQGEELAVEDVVSPTRLRVAPPS